MNQRYPLRPFRIQDRELLLEVIRMWPLATVFSGSAGAARMTLLPLLASDAGGDMYLQGHLDANNEHAAALAPGEPVSFHFRGPDTYASPDPYPYSQLPGWLYISVHGQGTVSEFVQGHALRELLVRSTQAFGGNEQAFQLDHDDDRIDLFISDIRGFTIDVTEITGIAKLAQDKSKEELQLMSMTVQFLLETL